MLQALISGFGGLKINDQGIIQNKTGLPKKWKSLKIIGVRAGRKEFFVK
jgi:hypothetical protein